MLEHERLLVVAQQTELIAKREKYEQMESPDHLHVERPIPSLERKHSQHHDLHPVLIESHNDDNVDHQ